MTTVNVNIQTPDAAAFRTSQASIMANIRARHKMLERRERAQRAQYVAGFAMIDRSGLMLDSDGHTPDERDKLLERREKWRDWLARYAKNLGRVLRGDDEWG
jgi:hypothetical protein